MPDTPASLEMVAKECIESLHLVFRVREDVVKQVPFPHSKCEMEGLWVSGPSASYPMVELWVELVSNKTEFLKENIQFLGMGHGAHPLTSLSFLGPALHRV